MEVYNGFLRSRVYSFTPGFGGLLCFLNGLCVRFPPPRVSSHMGYGQPLCLLKVVTL